MHRSLGYAWICALVVGVVSACNCGGAPEPQAETGESSADPTAAAIEAAPVPLAPPPRVELRVAASDEPTAAPGRLDVQIVNREATAIQLASPVRLERMQANAWEATAEALGLGLDCEPPEDPCVELVSGAELRPGWLATKGPAPCECAECASLEAGQYRLVARGCDDRHAPIVSEPFEF